MALPPNLPPKPWTDGQEWIDPDNCATYIYSDADGKWYTSCCGGEPDGDPENPGFTGGFAGIKTFWADETTKTMGVGNGGRVILSTNGGKNFAEVTTNITVDLNCVIWAYDKWYVGGKGGYIGYSTDDGKNWTTSRTGGRDIIDADYDPVNQYMIMAQNEYDCWHTSNGTSWTAHNIPWNSGGGKGIRSVWFDEENRNWFASCCTSFSSERYAQWNGTNWYTKSWGSFGCPRGYYISHGWSILTSPDHGGVHGGRDVSNSSNIRPLNPGTTSQIVGAFYSRINDMVVVYCRDGKVFQSNDWVNMDVWEPAPWDFTGIPFGQNVVTKFSSNDTHEVIGFNEQNPGGIGYRPS